MHPVAEIVLLSSEPGWVVLRAPVINILIIGCSGNGQCMVIAVIELHTGLSSSLLPQLLQLINGCKFPSVTIKIHHVEMLSCLLGRHSLISIIFLVEGTIYSLCCILQYLHVAILLMVT